jgi:ribonuclease E
MPKKMLIDATHAEETRVVVVDGNKVEEFDFETLNKRQLAGNIYLAKVTRVEPSLQAAFVDYGGNRHGFLAFAEIHPDYYQIPIEDRRALIEEERALARAEDDEDNRRASRPQGASSRGPKPRPQRGAARAEASAPADAVAKGAIGGMDVVDLGEETGADALFAQTAQPQNGEPSDQPSPRRTVPVADDQSVPENGDAEEAEPRYRAMDHASETDDEIESIADEDVGAEISTERRQPRARRYKIQEVVKVRQIMLVQVVKEERGNKGAALTTYLSLAGRYCVLMPNTARGGGISRKITQAADRKKLREIADEIEVPEGAGLIIRTAGSKRTKAEIRRDYEYLMRLWEQIRELTFKSMAPAAVYEEGDLIKRTIRDLYSREIDEILVEGETGYRTAKDFMRMIMPSHARLVQRYNDQTPLFAKFQVESYLSGMFNPTVQLKSGRATKEGSIEETALKTNLEASDEVARQLRLRDLAGLIVIDFIDMEERRNNLAVEKRLKDKLKTDRARIQVGRISGFGLLEMSRQRLRPGMLESTTQPCAHCHGTGLIRSDDSLSLTIIRALEEEGTRKRSKEVLLKAPVAVVNFLMNQKREHISMIEARYGMSVRVEADPALISPDYVIDKFKTATRVVPEPSAAISGNAGLMGALVEDEDDLIDPELDLEEDDDEEELADVTADAATGAARADGRGDGRADGRADVQGAAGTGKKKRRRRSRKKKSGPFAGAPGEAGAEDAGEAEAAPEIVADAPADAPVANAAKPKRVRAPKPSTKTKAPAAAPVAKAVRSVPVVEAAPEAAAEATPKPKAVRARTAKPKAVEESAEPVKPAPKKPAAPKAPAKPKAAKAVAEASPPAETAAIVAAPARAEAREPEPVAEAAVAAPKRKGWWSLGS